MNPYEMRILADGGSYMSRAKVDPATFAFEVTLPIRRFAPGCITCIGTRCVVFRWDGTGYSTGEITFHLSACPKHPDNDVRHEERLPEQPDCPHCDEYTGEPCEHGYFPWANES